LHRPSTAEATRRLRCGPVSAFVIHDTTLIENEAGADMRSQH
jgi:hypothetical protein